MNQNPAITISRSLGSGGTEIAFNAARLLGWHFIDRRLMRLAAQATGQSTQAIAWQEEHRHDFWDHLLAVFAMGTCETPCAPLLEMPIYSKDLYQLERRLMFRMLDHAPSVIVGRGGFVALKGRPATLHVSIHAPKDLRLRSQVARGLAPNEDAALKAIEASDRNRGKFIRAISGLDWRDPSNFHLVLVPTDMNPDTWAAQVVEAFRTNFPEVLNPK